MIKVGVMTFLDTRDEMLEKRRFIVDAEIKVLSNAFKNDFDLISFEPIRTKNKAIEIAKKIQKEEVDLVIMHLPVWSSPDLLVSSANYINRPLIVLGNMRADSSSLVAVLASCGSFDQIGIEHIRIVGDLNDEKIKQKIISVAKASYAISHIKGQTFGYIGGCPLGMYTTAADASQWQHIFGVEIKHLEQSEIICRAENIKEDEVKKYLIWLKNNLCKIIYDKDRFTEEKLKKQIRSYLGTKKLITEYNLDFLGIKCQTELSDRYILQCLNVALLNDPYDADGKKEPVVCACEADADGALTMQIMKYLSGGKPTTLMDVRALDEKTRIVTLGNCGGMSTYYTCYSNEQKKNLKEVKLMPHVFGKAGGGATQYVCGKSEVTLARLMRKKGKYWMAIISGKFVPNPKDEVEGVINVFPHAFLKSDLDCNEFINTYGSNHIHAVQGDIKTELIEFCRMLNIEYKIYNG